MTVHTRPTTTLAAEGLPRRRFTVTEVEAMVAAGIMEEDERVELIGGELVPMSAKGNRHEVIKSELNDRWVRARPDHVRLTPETTFRLSEDTYLEPDFVIFDQTSGLTGLTGDTVLLVVEIADSSLRYDTGRKAALYASFGVRELWVIEAVAMSVHVFRDPSADGYRTTSTVLADATVTPAIAPDAFALRLDDLGI
jgi:Uma2 family endonuclease